MDLQRFPLIFITPPCSFPSILLIPSTLYDKSKRLTGCADSNSDDGKALNDDFAHVTTFYSVLSRLHLFENH
ncbi:hypothetical protein M422DRAFT_34740, partial [Sphaerobolus stellatus SS14]